MRCSLTIQASVIPTSADFWPSLATFGPGPSALPVSVGTAASGGARSFLNTSQNSSLCCFGVSSICVQQPAVVKTDIHSEMFDRVPRHAGVSSSRGADLWPS